MTNKIFKHSKGVSIIEALLAAVIVGIGFISVYTMTTTATRITYNASLRDNDTLSTSMILDDIVLDNFSAFDTNYHDAITPGQYNNLDLTANCDANQPAANARKRVKQRQRWCNYLQTNTGGMGTAGTGPSGNDERQMFVRNVTLTSNGDTQTYKVIGLRIDHRSRNRNQTKFYRKILHE